jgi:hypothetical protein
MFYKYGGKQLYYFNTYDGATDEMEPPAHSYEGQPLPELTVIGSDEDDCDSCKI